MDNSVDKEHPVAEHSSGELRPLERRCVRRRLVQSTLFPHKPQDHEDNGDAKGEIDCDQDENGEDEECCGSQSKSKRKGKGNATTTPKRASKKVREKRSGDTPKKKLTYIQNEDAAPVIPDLRLEAKLMAEENSRMFAGRQIHPFFSSRKSSKKNQEVIEVEGSRSPIGRKNKEITCGPIHVYERIQEDEVSLDWRSWNFCEETFEKRQYGLENTCSSVFEGSVQCLSFDKLPIVSHPSNLSNLQNETSSYQCCNQQEYLYEKIPTVSDASDDEQVICHRPLKEADVWFDHCQDSKVDKVDFFHGRTDCERELDIEQQSRSLDKRMISYYFGCGKQPGDSLWTQKYQPKKALEVCGNDESVKFLNEWLRLWHVRDFQISKDHTANRSDEMQDKNYSCSENYSDSEGKNEEASRKNVLLVTGPVGSGKSAAIYACAQEQGFEVIEVNASECRNGALVKQRFGEALESHQLKRPLSNPVGSQYKHLAKSHSALADGTTTREFAEEVVEQITLVDENLHNVIGASENGDCEGAQSSCHQSEAKALILFEDVDITFLEDRGFIAAVQQIAETAKGPIILTSNSPNPLLPDNLDRVQIPFTLPSSKELLFHIYMVCSAERIKIQPHLLERFIESCNGDIRKVIMQLQFWCQGRRSRKARTMKMTYGSLLFDLETGHQILPKLIPWDLPSQLSELVAKEITESLSMKETSNLTEVVVEQVFDNQDVKYSLDIHNNEAKSIEAKKVAMLSRNGSLHDYDDFTDQFDKPIEFSNDQGNPFSCFRRGVRRMHDVVLSSDSEDEFFNSQYTKVPDKHTDEALIEAKLPCSGEANIDGNHYECSETADIHITDTCESVDVSCVPESSFVPETEINNGTELQSEIVSSGHVGDTVEEVSVSYWLPAKASSILKSKFGIHENSDMLASSYDGVTEFPRQEEVEGSQSEHVEAVAREYQMMDEFNHIGSNAGSKFLKPKSLVETDLVQESWNKLKLQSEIVSSGHVGDTMEEVSVSYWLPAKASSLLKSKFGIHENSDLSASSHDGVTEFPRQEEVDDSQSEHVEAVAREYQVMDEFSRIGSNSGSKFLKPKSLVETDLVQESWNKLRSCRTDLRQYAESGHEHAFQIVHLTHRMTDLISEADLLLSNCQLLTTDSLEPSMTLSEESDAYSLYDERLLLASTIAQHGFCFYAKNISAVGSTMGCVSTVDLASEMLASATCMVALGKLVGEHASSPTSYTGRNTKFSPPKSDISLKSENKSCLFDIVRSIVPSRSYLALKGVAFNEYLSSMRDISQSEASRLSENIDKTRKRRKRVARHYLSSGTLMLSPEEISMLGQYNLHDEHHSQYINVA